MDRTTLIAQVELAFADVPRPTDAQLLSSPYNVANGEILRTFGGKRFQEIVDITQHGLVSDYEEIESMSPAGIHYFLPCYLRYVIDEPGLSRGMLCLVVGLVPFLARFHREDALNHPVLSPSQRRVVAQTLQYMLDNLERFDLEPFEAETRSELLEELARWNTESSGEHTG